MHRGQEVLSDELTLSRDLKEAREEVMPVTENRGWQTVGTVSDNLLSRSVLGGTSGKDAGVRGGEAAGF